jgi:hypothetical protein
MSKNTIEFNQDTVPRGHRANSKICSYITIHSKAGTLSFSQSLYRVLKLDKKTGIKFKLENTDLYIYKRTDNNAFPVRQTKGGNMLNHSMLARKILEMVDTNIYSATLEVVQTDIGFLANTNEPLKMKKGAPV